MERKKRIAVSVFALLASGLAAFPGFAAQPVAVPDSAHILVALASGGQSSISPKPASAPKYPPYVQAPTSVIQVGPLGALVNPMTGQVQVNTAAPICTLDQAIAAEQALQGMIERGAKGFPKQNLVLIEINAQVATNPPDPKLPIGVSNPPQAFSPPPGGYANVYPAGDDRREYAIQIQAGPPVSGTAVWTYTWDMQPYVAAMSVKGVGAPGVFVSAPLPASKYYGVGWQPQ